MQEFFWGRYKRRKRKRQEIAAAMLYEGDDNRFYTRISIGGHTIEGLLDSGATVPCLGKGSVGFVRLEDVEVPPFYSIILGRVNTTIAFNKKSQAIVLYLVPSLSRELFLGVDFMKFDNQQYQYLCRS